MCATFMENFLQLLYYKTYMCATFMEDFLGLLYCMQCTVCILSHAELLLTNFLQLLYMCATFVEDFLRLLYCKACGTFTDKYSAVSLVPTGMRNFFLNIFRNSCSARHVELFSGIAVLLGMGNFYRRTL